MLLRKIVAVVAALAAALGFCCHAAIEVKVGVAGVCVEVQGASAADLEGFTVSVSTSSLFAGLMEDDSYFLTRTEGSRFCGEVPMELTEEVAGLFVEGPGESGGKLVTLRQGVPNQFVVELGADGSVVGLAGHNETEQLDQLGTMFLRVCSEHLTIPKSKYRSWRDVMSCAADSIWPGVLSHMMEGEPVPANLSDWFLNSVKCRFASQHIIPYVKAAERNHGITVEEPPMQAYSYLNEIDYSDKFLKHLPHSGLKSFLYSLLRFPGGGFGAIGDKSVADWQKAASLKMRPAIKAPTPLLLDLLCAMSYVEQIEIKNTPLTAAQIKNIRKGFTRNDLGKILLAKNDALVNTLADNDRYIDLSAGELDIEAYVKEHYGNRPVVIDMWNTWCSPCRSAIATTEELKARTPHSPDIAFIYLCDTTSPADLWRRQMARVDGIHIRVPLESAQKFADKMGLTGVPSYVVYDRNHRLLHHATGFPGPATYLRWLNELR